MGGPRRRVAADAVRPVAVLVVVVPVTSVLVVHRPAVGCVHATLVTVTVEQTLELVQNVPRFYGIFHGLQKLHSRAAGMLCV
jgi:hypothetical protein